MSWNVIRDHAPVVADLRHICGMLLPSARPGYIFVNVASIVPDEISVRVFSMLGSRRIC